MKDIPRSQVIIAIGRILSEKSDLEDVVEAFKNSLSQSQLSWFREVCSGVMRSKGRLDYILDQYCLKKKPTGWTRRALIVAIYQIIFQEDLDPKFVVNETVSLIQSKEGVQPSKFANAVLRKISDHRKQWQEKKSEAKALSDWLSLPAWIYSEIKSWKTTDIEKMGAALLERPKCFIIWNPKMQVKSKVLEKYPVSEINIENVIYYQFDEPSLINKALNEYPGAFYVQDISNQILVRAAHEWLVQNTKTKILDLCASPGGKSIGLSFLGHSVFSADQENSVRLGRLSENLKQYAPDSHFLSDQAQVEKNAPYDLIWIDAPCSGSGIIRRHPEIRWNRTPEQLLELKKIQQNLILKACTLLSPSGVIFYSVCSILPSECEEQIAKMPLKKLGNSLKLIPGVNTDGDGFFGHFLTK